MKMSGVVYHFLSGATNATNCRGNRAGRSGGPDGITGQSIVNICGTEETILAIQSGYGATVVRERSILVIGTLVSLVINNNRWTGPVSGSGCGSCAKRENDFNWIAGRVRYYRSIGKLANKSPIRIDAEDHIWTVNVPSINQVVLWSLPNDRLIRVDSIDQVVPQRCCC